MYNKIINFYNIIIVLKLSEIIFGDLNELIQKKRKKLSNLNYGMQLIIMYIGK